MAREQRDVAPAHDPGLAEIGEPFLHDRLVPAPVAIGDHVRLGARQRAATLVLGLIALTAAIQAPLMLMKALTGLFLTIFLASALVRLAAVLTPRRCDEPPALADNALPAYSLIVPLYREAEVAAELIANLARIDYPRDRLQALIVLEADDEATRAAFRAIDLPSFVQIMVAPQGLPRTKPRACNVALEWARGELVVIYDAEDAPDPNQLREVAARFAAGATDLACVQAPLRIETPRYLAFIAEQFRLEYASLFEVLLPAYARWGLAFPLGGTSNHFRTRILREAGGWDPFNVTEDADIGFRLAGRGLRLGLARRPTLETAPTTLRQWTPQRARWIKGHLQTLTVHTRLGAWRRPQVVLALLITLALPLAAANLHAPAILLMAMNLLVDLLPDSQARLSPPYLVIYAFGWTASAVSGALGVMRAGERPRLLHLFGMVGYWPMWILAAPVALWQFVFAPHRWDKTRHAPRTGRTLP